MFDNFSERSRQVLFAARFKTGERGATAIETDDFLVALVLEDQGLLAKTVFAEIFEGQDAIDQRAPSGANAAAISSAYIVEKGQRHLPFFSAEVADDLLADLKKNLPQYQPIPLTTEIPLSSSLERVFDSAKAFQAQFRQKEVEPLHFLAAILKEDSGEGAKLLQHSGITLESVLSAISTGEN